VTLPAWLTENRINVLAIHQGMLDKMFESRDNVKGWIDGMKKTIPFIIVESDRGEGLLVKRPRNARFAPFSSIEPWLRPGTLSKYHLLQTLFSSARGSHKDDEAVDNSSDR
jgi:hypothetical protein